jgi:cytidylate kinase
MHISITGRLGSGKSTVAKLLAESEGFEIYSTGAIQRRIAADMGLTTLQMNQLMNSDHKYDHMLDDTVTKISLERAADTLLFDSRMAWHFARGSFKVYLFVDTAVAARRVIRDCRGDVECYASVDDAIEQLNARMLVENARYRELYGVDHLDLNNFDLVVNTENISPEKTCEIIMSEFNEYCKDPDAYARPRMFYMDGAKTSVK